MKSRLLAIFLGAVAFDDPKAAFSLYLLLSTGADDLKPNREQADYWLAQASNGLHPPAMKELGLRMLRGIGMERRPPLAFELLFAAGQAGEEVGEPLVEAEAQTPRDLAKAIKDGAGKEVTAYGYLDAVSRLSQQGCAPEPAIGQRLGSDACPLGPIGSAPERTGNRPWLDRMRSHVDADDVLSAMAVLEGAAQSGDVLALIMLGDILENPVCGLSDPARSARLYREAASKGDAMARLYLGDLYETGRGVERDLDKARDLYRRAQLTLLLPDDDLWETVYGATMGRRGITPLLREQRQWLRGLLADPDRALALSDEYLVRTPPEGCLACLLLAHTEPRTEKVLLRLAQMHMDGIGVAKNFHNARIFSHLAAKAGSQEAHYRMGLLLLEGRPDPPEPFYAFIWLLRARDLGVAVKESDILRARSMLSKDQIVLATDWSKSPPPPLPRIYGYEPSQPFCASSD